MMIHRVVSSALVLAAVVVAEVPDLARAQCTTLDQEIPEQQLSSPLFGVTSTLDRAQTFTVGMSGELSRVDIWLVVFTGAESLFVDVRATNSGAPVEEDAGLTSVAIPASEISVGLGGWYAVDLSAAPVHVVAGQQLAVALRSVGNFGWKPAEDDSYAGGTSYARDMAGWVVRSPNRDLSLRTYVCDPVSVASASWAEIKSGYR